MRLFPGDTSELICCSTYTLSKQMLAQKTIIWVGFFFILSLSKQDFRFSLSMLMFGVHSWSRSLLFQFFMGFCIFIQVLGSNSPFRYLVYTLPELSLTLQAGFRFLLSIQMFGIRISLSMLRFGVHSPSWSFIFILSLSKQVLGSRSLSRCWLLQKFPFFMRFHILLLFPENI